MEETRPDFMSALVTEHFILQSAASTTVSESGSRASLYLMTLSSAMVAMGFASQSPHALVPLAASVLPVVFVVGVFTVVRLVDTGVENMRLLAGIARIRGYYRTLGPDAPFYFGLWGGATAGEADDHAEALAMMAGKARWTTGLFTIASMIAVIDSIVAGVGVGLLVCQIFGHGAIGAAVPVGLVVASLLAWAFYRYQSHRYGQIVPHPAVPNSR